MGGRLGIWWVIGLWWPLPLLPLLGTAAWLPPALGLYLSVCGMIALWWNREFVPATLRRLWQFALFACVLLLPACLLPPSWNAVANTLVALLAGGSLLRILASRRTYPSMNGEGRGADGAQVDALTGLHNKRFLTEALRQTVSMSREISAPLSLLMLEVDHFSRWNDAWGRQAGDLVLKDLGGRIRELCRDSDIPCRYGGESFCVLLPRVDSGAAMHLAERLREEVAAMRWQPRAGESGGLTVSIGVAGLSADDDMYRLIARSDKALVQAKQDGRNRCVLAE